MSSFEILRRVTKPTTDAKVMEYVRTRYGVLRDTIGSDAPATEKRTAASYCDSDQKDSKPEVPLF